MTAADDVLDAISDQLRLRDWQPRAAYSCGCRPDALCDHHTAQRDRDTAGGALGAAVTEEHRAEARDLVAEYGDPVEAIAQALADAEARGRATAPGAPPLLIMADTPYTALAAARGLGLTTNQWQYLDGDGPGLRARRHVRVHLAPRWHHRHNVHELLAALAAIDTIDGGVEWHGCDPPPGWGTTTITLPTEVTA